MSPTTTARPLTEASSDPAYLALADELEALVARLDPGDRLPSEHELTASHSVSRLTARASLQELEGRMLVRRVRGAGTFVARRIEYPVGPSMPPSASEMVRRAGGIPTSQIVSVQHRRPTAEVRDALGLGSDDRVVAITRTGQVDGLPASFGTSHLPADLASGITGYLDDGASIYRLLSDEFGLTPVRSWARAELVVVPRDVAPELGADGRPLVWRLESCNEDRSLGRPVELSQTWLRADVYRVRFELGEGE